MPIVSIVTPDGCDQAILEEIERRIQLAVASIKKLWIFRDQVTVLFPEDKLKKRRNLEVIATVNGLFKTPERTKEVRKELAEEIVEVLKEFFPKAALIECLVISFDPEQGFASYSPKK